MNPGDFIFIIDEHYIIFMLYSIAMTQQLLGLVSLRQASLSVCIYITFGLRLWLLRVRAVWFLHFEEVDCMAINLYLCSCYQHVVVTSLTAIMWAGQSYLPWVVMSWSYDNQGAPWHLRVLSPNSVIFNIVVSHQFKVCSYSVCAFFYAAWYPIYDAYTWEDHKACDFRHGEKLDKSSSSEMLLLLTEGYLTDCYLISGLKSIVSFTGCLQFKWKHCYFGYFTQM